MIWSLTRIIYRLLGFHRTKNILVVVFFFGFGCFWRNFVSNVLGLDAGGDGSQPAFGLLKPHYIIYTEI